MFRNFALAPFFQLTSLFLVGARSRARLQIPGCHCRLEELGGQSLTFRAGHCGAPWNIDGRTRLPLT